MTNVSIYPLCPLSSPAAKPLQLRNLINFPAQYSEVSKNNQKKNQHFDSETLCKFITLAANRLSVSTGTFSFEMLREKEVEYNKKEKKKFRQSSLMKID